MTKEIDSSTSMRFTSRIGLILSALGVAVGTGNIWRFPRIAAQNAGDGDSGAGAFLIAWVVFLFMWSIPLIIAEYAIGKKYRGGVVKSMMNGLGKRFTWVGTFVAFVPCAITFFYTVVVGWCMYYFIYVLFNPLPVSYEASIAIWESYQASYMPIITFIAAIIFGAIAIWKGIGSIEKVNMIMIPTLLLIVVICVIRAVTLPGAEVGLGYLFRADLSQLGNPKVWLDALTQNAWDTGAGWGLFLTYAAYMKVEHGTVKNAFITGIGNNTVSILSGIMIFGTVFAILRTDMGMTDPEILEIMKTSGPASTGLTFIWMPQLFHRMFGGGILAILFFLGLTFAGFTSLIAQLELPTRVFVDTGLKRKTSILIVCVMTFVFGLPSAVNLHFLSNQDFVWGVALMISGALIAFLIIKQGTQNMRTEINSVDTDSNVGLWWSYIMKYFIPVAALALLIWWLSQSFVPGEWYNPFTEFSFMSCIFQWSIIIILAVILNKKITSYFSS